jgi:hypothetical protein
MRSLLVFMLFYLLGCQPALVKTEKGYQPIQADATIEITQELTVAANSARAFLQNGRLIRQNRLNLYDINCEIEINTVKEQSQTVPSGLFTVVSVSQQESPIVFDNQLKNEVQVASLNYAWSSNSPVDIKRYYTFKLVAQSNSKPQVRALICRGIQETPWLAQLPTLEEMKRATGLYIILSL